MDTIVYNPVFFKKEGDSYLKSVEVKDFAWEDEKWYGIAPAEIKVYPNHVAKEMVSRWGFLKIIKPDEVETVKRLMKEDLKLQQKLNGQDQNAVVYTARELAVINELKKISSKKANAIKKDTVTDDLDGDELPKNGVKDWVGDGIEEDIV